MGCFSWLDCQTGTPVIGGVKKKVYVLVPEEFGGGHITEECYDNYGRFGGFDIYDLIAIWNRKWIAENPRKEILIREGYHRLFEELEWFDTFCDLSFSLGVATKKYLERYKELHGFHGYLRYIGIDIGCKDENKAVIKYPPKITYNPYVTYEECGFSENDPNQGCFYSDSEVSKYMGREKFPDEPDENFVMENPMHTSYFEKDFISRYDRYVGKINHLEKLIQDEKLNFNGLVDKIKDNEDLCKIPKIKEILENLQSSNNVVKVVKRCVDYNQLPWEISYEVALETTSQNIANTFLIDNFTKEFRAANSDLTQEEADELLNDALFDNHPVLNLDDNTSIEWFII